MEIRRPRLSVIVPCHSGVQVLPYSLSALLRSDLPRDEWELILVDDASTDDTAVVGARYADTVVRLPGGPSGPAYARNRGFEASRGDVIAFVDADVCVHRDTLRRLLTALDQNPDASAVFGSYDSNPTHGGLVSQFRNLLHHFVHQRSAGDAETFWAGCGAIRADAFTAVGMFDDWHYHRPEIEDIELGRRLRLNGHRILLRPEIQGTHLKRWTLRGTMATDLQSRGVPWTRLLLQEGSSPGSEVLNLRAVERICALLAVVFWMAVAVSIIAGSGWPLIASAAAPLGMMVLNRDFYRFVARTRGILSALGMLPLHLLFYSVGVVSAVMGWVLHMLLGEPNAPVSVAAAEGIEFRTWPPRPLRPETGVWNQGSRNES